MYNYKAQPLPVNRAPARSTTLGDVLKDMFAKIANPDPDGYLVRHAHPDHQERTTRNLAVQLNQPDRLS